MRRKNFFISFLFLVIGALFVAAGSVSAQANEPVRVITLSDSGFEQAHSVAFFLDGNFLAVGGTSGIYLYDFQKSSVIHQRACSKLAGQDQNRRRANYYIYHPYSLTCDPYRDTPDCIILLRKKETKFV